MSPRVYLSTNPWKITATFQAITSSREEYVAFLEQMKAAAPSEPKAGEKRSKIEQGHLTLVKALEERLSDIDAEIAVSIPDCHVYEYFILVVVRWMNAEDLFTANTESSQEDTATSFTHCSS